MTDSTGAEPISAHYRAGFASIGRAISLAKDWETKKLAWANGLHEALTKWNGIPRTDVISGCHAIAEAKELIEHFGHDEIQRILSDEVLKAAEPAKSNGADARTTLPNVLPFTLFDEINVTPKAWLAKDFLGAGETSCWYGHPGDGKSVLVEDFGLHVAAHMPWHDREVLGGAVLYIALERVQLVKRRALAFKIKHDVAGLPFAIMGGVLDLRDRKTADAVLQVVAEVEKRTGEKVVLIIIDTISRALCGGDENSPKDMGALINTVGRIQDASSAHVALVHHVPHEADRMRGHGSLLGAIDTTVHIVKGTSERSGTIIKDNDGADGQAVHFTLDSVELCSDGNNVTTAPVVVPTEGGAATGNSSRVGNAAKIALRLLHDAIAEAGTIPPASNHMPPNSRTCSVETWRSYCYSGTVTDSDNPDSKQKAFVRAFKTLQGAGLIGVWNDQVWVTGHAGHDRT